MKVKVEYTVEINDAERYGIEGHRSGSDKMANRDSVKYYLQENGTSGLGDMEFWYWECKEQEEMEEK